jgi:hypothetical protein
MIGIVAAELGADVDRLDGSEMSIGMCSGLATVSRRNDCLCLSLDPGGQCFRLARNGRPDYIPQADRPAIACGGDETTIR